MVDRIIETRERKVPHETVVVQDREPVERHSNTGAVVAVAVVLLILLLLIFGRGLFGGSSTGGSASGGASTGTSTTK